MRGFSDDIVPHHITFEAYGVKIRLRASSPELLTYLELMVPPGARLLPPAAASSSSSLTVVSSSETAPQRMGIVEELDGTYTVYRGEYPVHDGTGMELALVVLDSVVRSWVALHAIDRIFVHAGVVAHGDRAMILPGGSFSGKTTLVAALVKRGATYYSDEFAVFDHDGLVHPYPKPLSIRPEANDGGQVDTPVEALGGVTGDTPVPLGLAVVTYYVPGAEWRPRQLTRGEATLALLAHAVPAQSRSEQTMSVLSQAVDGATVLQGERGDADEFAETLLNLTPA